MNTRSRTINTLINIFVSVGTQIILLLLSFVTRTIFINQLGVEYLGLNGLFSNLLMVLALADLGIGTAMVYSLYKPVSNKDYKVITSLLNYFKIIYRILAIVMLALGLVLLPFIKYFVDVDIDINQVQIYYLLFLTNTVLSYLMIFKTALLKADQRFYIFKTYNFIFEIFKNAFQILVLVYFQSFILFLIVQLISTLLNNIFISGKVNNLYPFISDKADPINHDTKKTILGHVKAMFIYRFGGVVLNSTDNIIISVLIGTIWVGYYSNYYLVVGAIVTLCGLFFNSFLNSVGNLNANNPERSEPIFKTINFLNFWVYGFSSIALFILINDFIYLWLGEGFVLNRIIVIAIVLNVYIPGMLQGVSSFRDTTELFKKTKYVFILTATLNLFFSIVLGLYYGLAGILFATAIARILTNFWFEPFMLYKTVFKKSPVLFYLQQIKYAMMVLFSVMLLEILLSSFKDTTTTIFILKTILVVIISNLIFYLLYRKSDEFTLVKSRISTIILKYMKKDTKNNII